MRQRTSLNAALDKLLDSRLNERLAGWRQARVSAEAMARMLSTETGVEVSGETVRRWLEDLDDDDQPDLIPV